MSIVSGLGDTQRIGSPDESWQAALKGAVRDPAELAEILKLPPQWLASARQAAAEFPLVVPRAFLSRIRPGNPADPLLRQVAPISDELQAAPGFTPDPVDESHAVYSPGILHKYQARVLMVTTGVCAVHCRYCFRRHYPYSEAPKSLADWQPAIDRLAADWSVREVILSGGDPLTLPDRTLAALAQRLAAIGHLKRLRVHTRLPIVIPQRVNDDLLSWLVGTRLTPIVVVHVNHAQELDVFVERALARLVDAGVPVLNQAVLLAGVNDCADALVELCERLVDLRVMPYYLHQLDRVHGASHFEVSTQVGLRLMKELKGRLPGYAVPRYVCEVPGAGSKLEVTRD